MLLQSKFHQKLKAKNWVANKPFTAFLLAKTTFNCNLRIRSKYLRMNTWNLTSLKKKFMKIKFSHKSQKLTWKRISLKLKRLIRIAPCFSRKIGQKMLLQQSLYSYFLRNRRTLIKNLIWMKMKLSS